MSARQANIYPTCWAVTGTYAGLNFDGINVVPQLEKEKIIFTISTDSGELKESDAVRGPIPVVLARTDGGAADSRADALLLKGSTAFRRGQFEVATREFRAAANIDPASVDIWMGTLSKTLVSAGGYVAGSTGGDRPEPRLDRQACRPCRPHGQRASPRPRTR